MGTLARVLTRKKVLDPVSTEESQLGRVLNTVDLTALGVGSTLGVGVYVLAGQVAKDTAGPAVVLSFLIATVASVFAGLCYAEFGGRTPRAGSAYIYSYVCVGEFIAFVIGWNLILEYVIGSASVARGLSLYLDTLLNNTMEKTFREIAPINVDFMSEYFDFFSFGISILLSVALAFGMKESSMVNNVITALNLLVVIFVVIAGSIKADTKNWDLPAPQNVTHGGTGGFFPFGIEGMIKGAATCFYGFVGFDCIATTGEEVKNPKRAIPISIVLSLFIIFLAYFGTSTVITLMVPYYLQDSNAPIPHAFHAIGWEFAKWIVAIGGIFGLCASLFGAMFPLPRIIYAMASDGLIFRFLGLVNARFRTPVIGTLVAGLLTGLMSGLFELKHLVSMMSIGTLLAYTIVAACVLLLRFEANKSSSYEAVQTFSDSDDNETYSERPAFSGGNDDQGLTSDENDDQGTNSIAKQIFNCGRGTTPSSTSEKLVTVQVCIYCILCLLIGLCAMYLKTPISNGEIWAIVLTSLIIGMAALVISSMAAQPKSNRELPFKVPLVPLIPALSILINIYLMLMLDKNTWIRFAVWMAVGLPTYYFSVSAHSSARNSSIYSGSSFTKGKHITNRVTNGFTNQSYQHDEDTQVIVSLDNGDSGVGSVKKRLAPAPPTQENIESTIAALDKILESAEEEDYVSRKFSGNSVLSGSVEADVHQADAPETLTPSPYPNNDDKQDTVVSKTEEDCSTYVADDQELITASIDDKAEDKVVTQDLDNAEKNMGDTVEADEKDTELSDNKEAVIQDDKDPAVPDNRDPVVLDNKDTVVPDNETVGPDYNKDTAVPDSKDTVVPSSKDTIRSNVYIPPPPPFEGYSNWKESYDTLRSLPKFSSHELSTAKSRLVKRRPELSQVNHVENKPDDHIQFGTEEYKQFKEKLSDQLSNTSNRVPPLIVPNPKTISHVPIRVPPENVITDHLDRTNARVMLGEFLKRTPSMNGTPGGLLRTGNDDYDEGPANEVIKEEPPKKSPMLVGDDNLRANMDQIFKSIRLRKVDSFKTEQDTNENS